MTTHFESFLLTIISLSLFKHIIGLDSSLVAVSILALLALEQDVVPWGDGGIIIGVLEVEAEGFGSGSGLARDLVG